MKNYILDSSVKNIRYNKKRYVALVVGVILSTFLMTIVFNIGYNMKKIAIEEQTKRSGDYDFSFVDVGSHEYDDLKNDNKVNKDSICRIYFDTGKKFNELPMLDVDILSCDENMFSIMKALELKKGKFPTNENEIIIEDWVSNSEDKKIEIGDKISTIINDKSKGFEVVGFYKNFNTSQYENKVNFYSIINRDKLKDEKENIFFKLNKEIDVSKNFSTYRELVGEEHFEANNPVLILKGQHESIRNIDSMFMIILLLIPTVIISIVMIFNILNISLIQRMSDFGTLRTLGANKGMITKLILVETMIIGLVAIPIGIVISCLLIRIIGLFLIKFQILILTVEISTLSLLASVIVSFIIVIVSSFLGAREISKVNVLDAVFARDKGKDKKYKTKFRKIYSLEFDISDRSMKRNRKKYYLTLISITFSAVLIFVYFSVSNMTNALYTVMGEDIKTECNIFSTKNTTGDYEKTYSNIKDIEGINKIYKNYNMILGQVNIVGVNLNEENNVAETTKKLKAFIHVYDSERLKNGCLENYLMEGHVDINELEIENKVILVKRKSNEDIQIGQKISVLDSKEQVDIVAILSKDPFIGINEYDKESDKFYEYKPDVSVIISDKLYKKLAFDKLQMYGYDIVFEPGIDREITKEQIQNSMKKFLSDMRFIDKSDTLESRKKQVKMIFAVLSIVIAIIVGTSLLMLYNTTKSNVLMREKEIAMLKAIGMNSNQVNKTIINEAIIYSIKGWLFSIILGSLINKLLYEELRHIGPVKWSTPIYIPILTLVIITVASIIAVIPSIREIKKGSIIEKINIK